MYISCFIGNTIIISIYDCLYCNIYLTQVMQELTMVGQPYDIRVAAIYGGVSYEAQIKALQSGAQIIVGTPGRLLDHITKGSLDLSYIKHVVLGRMKYL